MFKTLKLFLQSTNSALRSSYKWILFLYVLWLYRVDFIPDTGEGSGKMIQIVSLFGMLILIFKYSPGVFSDCRRMNYVVSSFLYLYLFATASAIWSIMPSFSGFLAFQNVVLLLGFIWLFSNFDTFVDLERGFLVFTVMTILFESIVLRMTYQPWLFVHYLPAASSAAMCVSYCVGELLSSYEMDSERKSLLVNCIIICIVVLVTSTSAGANASAILGVAIACLLSGRVWISSFLALIGTYLYINRDAAEALLFFIMPGKTQNDIETATGRHKLWDLMLLLAAKRPWLGYGFGCIERAVTMTGEIKTPDAHNNYLGFYGSLGYIGSAIAYIHFAIFTFYAFLRRKMIGFVGIGSALGCALINGYTFGFLSGKACSITVVYIAIVVLTFNYTQMITDDHDSVE